MDRVGDGRIDWVDTAKGVCIILVVMMHSTLGVEKAAGATSWLNGFIEWAQPFRMPDFFLISGLFLAARIDRPWRGYLDTKVVHFAYFYLLWLTIQFAFKLSGFAAEMGAAGAIRFYLLSLIEPFGTLWFIYLLAVFFVVTKALRAVPVALVWAVAALLEIAPIGTGWLAIDEFCSRFVYFYTGYVAATHVFAFARRVEAAPLGALLGGLVVWGLANGWLVSQGLAHLPVVSLVAGFVGSAAVVAFAVMLTRLPGFAWLRICGERSIVIYLAFFLFMAASRTVLLRQDLLPDLGTIALIVTAAGVIGPLVLERIVRGTRAAFLFERPHWARLRPAPSARSVPRLARG